MREALRRHRNGVARRGARHGVVRVLEARCGEDGGDCGNFLGCDDFVCFPGSPGPAGDALAGPSQDVRCSDSCDPYKDSNYCSPGEKCVAIAAWPDRPALNANVCVAAGTVPPGGACGPEDGPAGTDSCDMTGTCVGQDRCFELCSGPWQSPTCDTPDTRCAVLNRGVLPLCTKACDPLALDPCETPSDTCLGNAEPGNAVDVGSTSCLPVPPPPVTTPGEPCYGVSECAEGLACVMGDWAELLCGGWGCCLSVCDQASPDPCGGEGNCLPLGEEAFPALGYCRPT